MRSFLVKYSWKSKNRALLLFSLVFGFCCYQLAIKPTLEARKAYKAYHSIQDMLVSSRSRIANLKKQTGVNHTEIRQLAGGTSEKELMVALASESKIVIRNLGQEAATQENGKEVLYNAYYFSASFTELLKLLSRAENETDLNILNVRFYADENPQTKRRQLIMKIETATIKEV